MIRHCCAACGRPINRTDRIFEPSDGTLCQDCLARLVPGKSFGHNDTGQLPPQYRSNWPLTDTQIW
jgi:hypothetical protein